MDNAIEANRKVDKERYIKVTAKSTGGLFYLEIANPMKGQLLREDDKILIEETIVGREIEVAVLEEKGIYTVSECAEIDAGAEFYDYEAKYISNTSSYYIPARLPDDIRAEVRRRAELIFRTLECNTLSRVDFFVCDNGDIVFNEINTLPGFTSISMYPKLMMHAGLKYSELIDRLVHALL
jgi:D-alanine-D-alanine ligase